nr:hypothetical protein [Tanacetum cinerariifolium]
MQKQLTKLNTTNVARKHKPELRSTKDFEAKYNKIKAKLALLSLSASAPISSSGKNKSLIAETYEWDEKEVSSNENEEIEVKALMVLAHKERVSVGKESANNSKWVISIQKLLILKQAKLDLLTMQHVNTEILKENQNLRNELKELTSIIDTWLNSSNEVNQYISEQIPTQKKNILGIDQLTKDTSNFGPKDMVFVKSSTNNSNVSITNSNKPMLSKVEDSTLANHDTGKVPSDEPQRNTTDLSVVVYVSFETDYDSADESLVYSTPLPPLEKLAGAKLVSGPKTFKSNLKSKSAFKARTLKGITLKEPSSATAKDNKKGEKMVLLKYIFQIIIKGFKFKIRRSHCHEFISKKISSSRRVPSIEWRILLPSSRRASKSSSKITLITSILKHVSSFESVKKRWPQDERNFAIFLHFKNTEIRRQGLRVLRDSFAYKEHGIRLMLAPRSPNMYKEYLAEFWYTTKALEHSKVSFSIPTGSIYGEVGVNTFRNVIGVHYLPHSSVYVAPPSIDIVRKWFETIGYGETVSVKGTL